MRRRLVGVLALVLTLASCASVVPPRGPLPSPQSPHLLPGWGRTWIATDRWDRFAQGTLWPQEWALRHWHRWTAVGKGLQWTPEGPLPPVPTVSPRELGGDPRWWVVDFPLTLATPPAERVIQGTVTFTQADAGRILPSTHALMTILQGRTGEKGWIRVDGMEFDGVRFLVRYTECGRSPLGK